MSLKKSFACPKLVQTSEPPPLPLTHPPFGSGMSRGSPMKFTTFHQHHQLVAHPQHVPTNGNYNGNNYQTQTIHVANQQHYMMPQQAHHHHHQQQFYDNNPQLTPGSNYGSRMSAPLGHQQQPQRSTAIWHQQYTSSIAPLKNDFNGNSSESG